MAALICPICRGEMEGEEEAVVCVGCGRRFPIEYELVDFSEGHYYDQFTPDVELSEEHLCGLRNEEEGTRTRICDYYLPLLRREREVRRVLDCGTGNGMSVDLLDEAGYEAWGLDLSALRKWQWRERRRRDRLVVADAMRLPFRDGWFDAILCSGLIEHIGVEEEGGDRYRVKPRPDRDAQRLAFLRELFRVLRPGGVAFLDFPNGAFPIDFWHGSVPGGARFHSRREGFLPTFAEVRALIAQADESARVEAIRPHRRLQFRQSRAHWYGRALAMPVNAFFRFMPQRIARSAINPFLVLRIARSGRAPRGAGCAKVSSPLGGAKSP